MKISKNDIYSKIFGFNPSTYYRWKEDKRPIIDLIDKYFSINELNEFLSKKEISRFELYKGQRAKTNYSAEKYLNIFLQKNYHIGDSFHIEFMDFYFNTLVYYRENMNMNIFNPMSIQKVGLNYMYESDYNKERFEKKSSSDDESYWGVEKGAKDLIQSFKIGIELLDDFDCYTNQFLQDCIFQDFKPLIEFIQNENSWDIDDNVKVEAYCHLLLFVTYDTYQNKTVDEKITMLLIILDTLEITNKKEDDIKTDLASTPMIDFLENTPVYFRVEKNLLLVEKNLNQILLDIKNYDFKRNG